MEWVLTPTCWVWVSYSSVTTDNCLPFDTKKPQRFAPTLAFGGPLAALSPNGGWLVKCSLRISQLASFSRSLIFSIWKNYCHARVMCTFYSSIILIKLNPTFDRLQHSHNNVFEAAVHNKTHWEFQTCKYVISSKTKASAKERKKSKTCLPQHLLYLRKFMFRPGALLLLSDFLRNKK